MAVAALALATACDQGGVASPGKPDSATPPAVTRVVQWPDNWPVPPLPVMSLQHEDGPIQGDPRSYCWQFEGATDRVCEEEYPWSGLWQYREIASHQRIPVIIEAETRPTKLFARVHTKPGNIMVGGLRRLSAVNPRLDLELSPGEYNVVLIGYWQDNNVTYEFGLYIPGEVELRAECEMTVIGADPVLSLESLDDPQRMAPDDANVMGCRFNKPIASRHDDVAQRCTGSYTETFHIDPPSITIGFPTSRQRSLREDRMAAPSRRLLAPHGRIHRGRRGVELRLGDARGSRDSRTLSGSGPKRRAPSRVGLPALRGYP